MAVEERDELKDGRDGLDGVGEGQQAALEEGQPRKRSDLPRRLPSW